MDHYDTNPAQVASVAAATAVSQEVAHAMLELGRTPAQIRDASPEGRFRDFCEWHGLCGWSTQLMRAMRGSGFVLAQLPAEALRDAA